MHSLKADTVSYIWLDPLGARPGEGGSEVPVENVPTSQNLDSETKNKKPPRARAKY